MYIPNGLARKYLNAPRSWDWQYAFPSSKLSRDPRGGATRRHHVNESNLQKAIRVVQKLLGHKDVKTNEIYTHVLQQQLHNAVSSVGTLK